MDSPLGVVAGQDAALELAFSQIAVVAEHHLNICEALGCGPVGLSSAVCETCLFRCVSAIASLSVPRTFPRAPPCLNVLHLYPPLARSISTAFRFESTPGLIVKFDSTRAIDETTPPTSLVLPASLRKNPTAFVHTSGLERTITTLSKPTNQ